MTLTTRILIGGGSGVALGLFVGEYAHALDWAAQGFVRLLQMTVLPYVTLSITTSLGTLRASEARTFLLRASAVVAGLWAIALVFAFLLPLTFPPLQTGTFFSTALVEPRPPFDFVSLYIPANPFYALANNIVPAVVLFSVLLGIALIGVERKQPLLDVLAVAQAAVGRATALVTRLMPFGLFAMAFTAAGTIELEQISRIQVFVISYMAMALFLSLWVLPGLVAALTPVSVRELLGRMRVAFLTAFMAGDLFIVLPLLIEGSRDLLAGGGSSERDAAIADVIVPASFNFPHAAKLLSISFILFAGWFSDAPVAAADYPALAATGLVTFFGSLNAAVPFLLDLFRIPADTFQLFLATGIVNARFGTLLAAAHTAAVAILGTCAATHMLRVKPAALLRYVATTAALTVLLLVGLRVTFTRVLPLPAAEASVLTARRLLSPSAEPAVNRVQAVAFDDRPRLEQIHTRGTLRVGYMADALPFSYVNTEGTLVGFDIDLAHRLARELGVAVAFVKIDRDRLREELAAGACDLVMAGVAVTTLRARDITFSEPYLDETVAFVVRDHDRGRYVDWDTARAQGATRLAMPDLPYYLDKLHALVPHARIVTVKDIADIFEERVAFDAAVLPAERASAWTLLHPQFAVVVPGPKPMRVPLAYPLAANDLRFESFVNTWIELKRRDGTLDALYRYWILGQNTTDRVPRWSIIRDVLGWVE